MSATTVPFPAQSRMFGKHFEYGRYSEVLAAMDGMLAGLPDGQACVLSTLDGHHLAHSAAPMLDSVRLAAVSSSLYGMAQTLARDLCQQGLVDVRLQTETGCALIQRLPRPGHQLVLLVACGSGSGADHADCAEQVRESAAGIAALCLTPQER